MLENLLRRFKSDLYKTTSPYNALTLLDVRYSDLYFNEDQKQEAIDVIYRDEVFCQEREAEDQPTPTVSRPEPQTNQLSL